MSKSFKQISTACFLKMLSEHKRFQSIMLPIPSLMPEWKWGYFKPPHTISFFISFHMDFHCFFTYLSFYNLIMISRGNQNFETTAKPRFTRKISATYPTIWITKLTCFSKIWALFLLFTCRAKFALVLKYFHKEKLQGTKNKQIFFEKTPTVNLGN